MTLAADIGTLRDRVLADLNGSHDYFADAKFAWRTVHDTVLVGAAFRYHNASTGTVTTQSDLIGKIDIYIAQQLTEATFQQFISIFETFFFDLLRLWLTTFPQSLIGKTVDFKAILEASDKDAIVQLAVERESNDVLYKRPSEWFVYLEGKVKLGCPTKDEIDRLAEAKASRDVLVHNRGTVGKQYLAKAGPLARYRDGERIDIPEAYHQAIWELIRKVVTEVSDAAIAKAV